VEERTFRGWAWPFLKFMDWVQNAYNKRSLELRDAKVKIMDRKQWRYLVNNMNGSIDV